MLHFYKIISTLSGEHLLHLLEKRKEKGKEDSVRLEERVGIPTRPRPDGRLIWFHGASVGETQSALILIREIQSKYPDAHIMVTSGTRTSANLLAQKLTGTAFHQYIPLDHPDWVEQFLSHWRPDLVLWMESELWPNFLTSIGARNIPAALLNARLSKKSFRIWSLFKSSARTILESFPLILAQTEQEQAYFKHLGASHVVVSGNLKYSAAPLAYDKKELSRLMAATQNRTVWLYASSHDGEEELAARAHDILKNTFPNLLTIIVPRHPERGEEIASTLQKNGFKTKLRGHNKALPLDEDIYVADTMGEMGLFYRLAPIACIGRSFSKDGGGGHNPIEAAQLHCAVLYGPHVQFQQEIFDDMNSASAAMQMQDEAMLIETLQNLLSNPAQLKTQTQRAHDFAHEKACVLNIVLKQIEPLLTQAGLSVDDTKTAGTAS